jgi:hypothetical protein
VGEVHVATRQPMKTFVVPVRLMVAHILSSDPGFRRMHDWIDDHRAFDCLEQTRMLQAARETLVTENRRRTLGSYRAGAVVVD